MGKVYESIDQLVGNTPIVRLKKIEKEYDLNVKLLVKLEMFNPAGSVKDRIAKNILEKAEKQGKIKEDTILVEASSGNTGIGLACMCAAKGYRLIVTMPESMSIERRLLLKAYGAEVVLTPASKGMKGAIEEMHRICEENENCFMPSQFENSANPEAHILTTGPEIYFDTDGEVDVFVAGIGTGGTISGVSTYLKSKKDVQIVGVEPMDSPVLTGGNPGPHALQGIGAGFIPNTLDTTAYDCVLRVSKDEAFLCGKQIAKKEGIFVGISSGAALAAAIAYIKNNDIQNKTVVVLLADTGERYLSSEFLK